MTTISVVGVVDDDAGIRHALGVLLRSAGFRVATFASAEDFLASGQLVTTACLILDLQMPGMDGLDLQQRLIDDGHRVPIVVLTAHGDDAVRNRALAAGALRLLKKPVDGEALLEAVSFALRTA
jgi:FixJ family two-component response regulator